MYLIKKKHVVREYYHTRIRLNRQQTTPLRRQPMSDRVRIDQKY